MASEKTERNRILIEMREYDPTITHKQLALFFGISAGRVSTILRKSRLPQYYCKQCDTPISYQREHRGNFLYGRGLCIQCIVWNRGGNNAGTR